MKKTIALSILLIISLSMFSQDDVYLAYEKKKVHKDSTLLYRSFEEFKGDTVKHLEYWSDTIAYLDYNFIKRIPEAYAGMTVREFMNMLPFPVVRIDRARYGGFRSLEFFIINELKNNSIDHKQAQLFITVGLDSQISREKLIEIISNETTREEIKNYTIRSAIIYKEFMWDYQRLMGIRQIYAKKRKEEARKE
ncbi:MAG: hypothetical protein LBV43_03580 [Prevotella sp.]|jgi:hypothetical protein|nr:hypothetical protein [Prevotella sp.]